MGIFTFLRVRLSQLQCHRRESLRLRALQQCELVILPVALVFEEFEIAAGVGDQAALHTKVANCALQLSFGLFEGCFGHTQVRLYTADICFDVAHFAGHGVEFLLLLFRQPGDRGALLALQIFSAGRQFLLGHA
jgi:hypothetical protein